MSLYHRRLPHWQPDGAFLFVTWRLYGSLPADVVQRLKRNATLEPGQRFRLMDIELDRAASGPLWLKDERISRLVTMELLRCRQEKSSYELYSFVVMANHVHVLLRPFVPLARVTNRIKGRTARHANSVLRRTGSRFWQDESYDHWVRDDNEFRSIRAYIESNPVKAGLIGRAEDWQWSSANPQWKEEMAKITLAD